MADVTRDVTDVRKTKERRTETPLLSQEGNGAPERSEERVGVVPVNIARELPAIARRFYGAQSAPSLLRRAVISSSNFVITQVGSC